MANWLSVDEKQWQTRNPGRFYISFVATGTHWDGLNTAVDMISHVRQPDLDDAGLPTYSAVYWVTIQFYNRRPTFRYRHRAPKIRGAAKETDQDCETCFGVPIDKETPRTHVGGFRSHVCISLETAAEHSIQREPSENAGGRGRYAQLWPSTKLSKLQRRSAHNVEIYALVQVE